MAEGASALAAVGGLIVGLKFAGRIQGIVEKGFLNRLLDFEQALAHMPSDGLPEDPAKAKDKKK